MLEITNSPSKQEAIFIIGAQIRNVLNRLENSSALKTRLNMRVREMSGGEITENFLDGFEGRSFDGNTIQSDSELKLKQNQSSARPSEKTRRADTMNLSNKQASEPATPEFPTFQTPSAEPA